VGPARDARELVENLLPEGRDLSLEGPSLPPLVGRLAVGPTSEAVEHLPRLSATADSSGITLTLSGRTLEAAASFNAMIEGS
jgi:hypothetical protein